MPHDDRLIMTAKQLELLGREQYLAGKLAACHEDGAELAELRRRLDRLAEITACFTDLAGLALHLAGDADELAEVQAIVDCARRAVAGVGVAGDDRGGHGLH